MGVTGGIGSGKSTVCEILETMGLSIYYADDKAKSLMNTNEKLKQSVKELFGESAYKDGKLNRKEIASQVFHDQDLLEQLNRLVHPAVKEDFENWVRSRIEEKVLVKEAALLFEAGSYKELDKMILVVADESIRIDRIKQRDPHRNESEIKGIIDKQWSDERKQPLADFIIDNSGSISLIQQVQKIFSKLS